MHRTSCSCSPNAALTPPEAEGGGDPVKFHQAGPALSRVDVLVEPNSPWAQGHCPAGMRSGVWRPPSHSLCLHGGLCGGASWQGTPTLSLT